MKEAEIKRFGEVIAPIARKYSITKVILFGSRAKGTETEQSDCDLLVTLGETMGAFKFLGFLSEAEEALNCKVDVITDTSDDAVFIENARKEGIVVYEL